MPDKELEMNGSAAASGGASLRLNVLSVLGGSQHIKIHRIVASERTRKRWKQTRGRQAGLALSLGDVGAGVSARRRILP